MRKYLLNFATDRYRKTQVIANALATHFGVDTSFSFNSSILNHYPKFQEKNREILSLPRGFGYWLWKPFLLLQVIKSVEPGDVVFYCDSGLLLISDPQPLFDICNQYEQVFFPLPGQQNSRWTKRDVLVAMVEGNSEIGEFPQITAQCHLWKNCPSSIQKLEEWLRFCENPHYLTDIPSVAAESSDFVEHRHDQSILSMLVYKWNQPLFRLPNQEGEDVKDFFPNSPYPQLCLATGALNENGQLPLLWEQFIRPLLSKIIPLVQVDKMLRPATEE